MRPYILLILASLAFTSCKKDEVCTPACGEYQECLDGICRDRNCRPPCRDNRACVRGVCLRTCEPFASSNPCGAGERCCEDISVCVDTESDFYNCGACGEECPADRSTGCVDGRCSCVGHLAVQCSEGMGCCEDGCVDLSDDPDNCGECGHSCGDIQCVGGRCRCSNDEPCPPEQECCADGCRNLTTDSENCGRCGFTCGSGRDCCLGECANTLMEAAHCGECGRSCPEGFQCCLGTCTDTNTDPFNCGECLRDCGLSGRCVGGSCQ